MEGGSVPLLPRWIVGFAEMPSGNNTACQDETRTCDAVKNLLIHSWLHSQCCGSLPIPHLLLAVWLHQPKLAESLWNSVQHPGWPYLLVFVWNDPWWKSLLQLLFVAITYGKVSSWLWLIRCSIDRWRRAWRTCWTWSWNATSLTANWKPVRAVSRRGAGRTTSSVLATGASVSRTWCRYTWTDGCAARRHWAASGNMITFGCGARSTLVCVIGSSFGSLQFEKRTRRSFLVST